MKRTPLSAGTTPLARTAPLQRLTPLQGGGAGLSRTAGLSRAAGPSWGVPFTAAPKPRAARAAGFSPRVKLLVRERAGLGLVEDAVCECCRLHLGRYGGQVQHLIARGMGGTSNPLLSTAVNAALLCGTAQDGHHGLAEARDRGMRAKGFWLPQGSDPRLEPMALYSGDLVWRDAAGGYLYEAPEMAA